MANLRLIVGDVVAYKTLPCKIIAVMEDGTLVLKDDDNDVYHNIKTEDVEVIKKTGTRKGPLSGKRGPITEPILVTPHVLANVPELQHLTEMERRFIVEYMKNPSKLGAYLAAGGRGSSINTANNGASVLWANSRVQAALKILNEIAGKGHRWDADKLHAEINRNYEIATAAIPVIDKRTGKPTGVYQINHAVAYKYIELQARMLGVLKDKVELTGKDGAPLQVQHQHSAEVLSKEHFERLTPEERILFYNLYKKAKGIEDQQPIIDGRPQPITENSDEHDQDHGHQEQEQGSNQGSQEAISDAGPQSTGSEPESH